MAEHLPFKERVLGSSPKGVTKNKYKMSSVDVITEAVMYITNNLSIKLEQTGRNSITAKLLLKDKVISEDTVNYEPRQTLFC